MQTVNNNKNYITNINKSRKARNKKIIFTLSVTLNVRKKETVMDGVASERKKKKDMIMTTLWI